MAPNGIIPNGTAGAPIDVSAVPSIVGINFGNSYASIAVLTKVRFTHATSHKTVYNSFG